MKTIQALLLLTLLCLVTACQAVSAAPFTEPIKVGLLLPVDGERRELGYSLLPAAFAATPAEIQSRPIEWVILDTHSDPDTAAQRAQELVTDPAVVYVVGPLLHDEAAAVAPILEEAGMAWLPLVPPNADGIARRTWEPNCWVEKTQNEAEEDGGLTLCITVELPEDTTAYSAALGSDPTPLSWLMWDATSFMVTQLEQAPDLNRATVHEAAEPYAFPPLISYESEE
jgi:hypothetical protein